MADSTGTGWPPGDIPHQVQAKTGGVEADGLIRLRGRTFKLGPQAGSNMLAGLKFVSCQMKGLTTDDPEGQEAMWHCLRACFLVTPACGACEKCDADQFDECKQLDEGDWESFTRFAIAICASEDEVFGCLQSAMEQMAARPTPPPSASSPPAPPTSARSRATYSALGIDPDQLPEAFKKAEAAGDLIDITQLAR